MLKLLLFYELTISKVMIISNNWTLPGIPWSNWKPRHTRERWRTRCTRTAWPTRSNWEQRRAWISWGKGTTRNTWIRGTQRRSRNSRTRWSSCKYLLTSFQKETNLNSCCSETLRNIVFRGYQDQKEIEELQVHLDCWDYQDHEAYLEN